MILNPYVFASDSQQLHSCLCGSVIYRFADVVPRTRRAPEEKATGKTDDERRAPKKQKRIELLSFGDEAEEDAAVTVRSVVKSAHDIVNGDARLVRAGTEAEALLKSSTVGQDVRAKLQLGRAHSNANAGTVEEFEASEKQRLLEKRKALPLLPSAPVTAVVDAAPVLDAPKETKDEKQARKAARVTEKAAAAARKESERLRRLGLAKLATANDELLSGGEARRHTLLRHKQRTGERERETLAKLSRFQASLASTAPVAAASAPQEREGAAGTTRFVQQGLYYAAEDEDDDEKGSWRQHALAFSDSKAAAATGSWAPSADDVSVAGACIRAVS